MAIAITAAALADQAILRLEIAVEEPLLVDRREAGEEVATEGDGVTPGDPAVEDTRPQAAAVDPRHHQKRPRALALAAHLEDHVDRGLEVADHLREPEPCALRHHQKRQPVHGLAGRMSVQRREGA